MPTSFRRLLALALLALLSAVLSAQSSKALTHDDYDQWKSLRGTTYSKNGEWVAYQIQPQVGDGVLEIRQSNGDVVYREPLGSAANFSSDGRYVVFTREKSKVEERNKKIAELRKQQQERNKPASSGSERASAGGESTPAAQGEPPARGPRTRGAGGRRGGGFGRGGAGGGGNAAGAGDLHVLDLTTGKVEKIGDVKRFTLADDAPVLLYQPEPKKAEETEKKDAGDEAGEPKAGEPKAGEPEPAAEPPQPGEGAPQQRPGAGERGARTRRGGRRPEGAAAAGGAGGRSAGRRGAGGAQPAEDDPDADPLEKKRPEGSELVIRSLADGSERKIADVVAFGLSRKAKTLWYHTSAKKPVADTEYGLFVVPVAGGDAVRILDGTVNVRGVTFTRDESALAFLSDREDFAADKPQFDIYLWDGQRQPARRIVYPGAPGIPEGKHIGSSVSFSRDGSLLQFRVEPPPDEDPLPILPEDKVTLDIWSYLDGRLQTQQARGRGRGGDETATGLYHRDPGRIVVIDDEVLRSPRLLGPEGTRLIATDSEPYAKETSWDGSYADVYVVNAFDGSKQLIEQKLRSNVSNSPGGRYLLWFGADFHWWSYDVGSGARRDLTGHLPVPFHRHDDDHPAPAGSYGVAGWTKNDGSVLLLDEFDVWEVSPATGDAVCVTDHYGRANGLELRPVRLPSDDEEPYVDSELYLLATNVETMASAVFTDVLARTQKPHRLFAIDKDITGLTSPVDSKRFFFSLSRFDEFPDLWTAAADFSGLHRLSDANPQQQNYRWGKAELVRWIDGNGDSRKGILVKPDDFDPAKKYPMMVYFYETMAERLHSYVTPQPGTSPNAAYYVSNGYLWFMPDVVYEIGYPGPSCVKCVVSGVQSLVAQGFVDPKRIGAAGHSWGGYQTAFLVTRTNIFRAVESGAPVSNMISAYGGIRYQTGMSRQFQYEKTQSRIGGTPWEYPMRYWENSPIFYADKVATPVLILHNDNDGAVPWTQGIEYFTALRRLGKEAYLFNYNGEAHGLGKRPNQMDWTRRMSEYFDHHLKGEPAPKWMTEGVPYEDRDTEKLPFTPSYIEAYVDPKPETAPEPEPEAAEPAVEKPEPNGESPAPAAAPEGNAKGQQAPGFTVRDEAGDEHRLSDYRGRKLLLWFYPKAGTPG